MTGHAAVRETAEAASAPSHAIGPGQRLHGLDALRAGTMLLVIVIHAALAHVPAVPEWSVRDRPSFALGLVVFMLTLFVMTVFLFISGYFGRAQLEKIGVPAFLRDRGLRILLPFLVFWPITYMLVRIDFAWGDAVVAAQGETPPPRPGAGPGDPFLLMHLWFLYLLSLFYMAAVAIRALPLPGLGLCDMLARKSLEWRVGALLLSLPLTAAIVLFPHWSPWIGIPTPADSFLPNIYALVGYGVAFAAGWIVQRQPDLLAIIARQWPIHIALAIVLTAAMLALLMQDPPEMWMLAARERGLYALCHTLASWTWSLGLIGVSLRFFAAPNASLRYGADSSYWLYIAHLPLVMAIQVLLYPADIPPLAKFSLNTLVSAVLLLASYHLFVRRSWIGAWLNGRKATRPATG